MIASLVDDCRSLLQRIPHMELKHICVSVLMLWYPWEENKGWIFFLLSTKDGIFLFISPLKAILCRINFDYTVPFVVKKRKKEDYTVPFHV